MSVWYCIPSARAPAEVLPVLTLWKTRGYKIALYRDSATPGVTPPEEIIRGVADFVHQDFMYPGYALAVNTLVHTIMKKDSAADWFVTGGDDIHPDPNHTAEEIAGQCFEYFIHHKLQPGTPDTLTARLNTAAFNSGNGTFGVMQPTGDRWGDRQGAYADRVCGSPWMGREFCRRIYGGHGPIWPEFQHMFEDEHLQAVAVKLGILWQRPDLIHYHEHWVRKANDTGGFSSREDFERRQPAHYKKWSNREHWNEAKAIFDRLKAAGFKEAEDLLP